jgi:kynureninase
MTDFAATREMFHLPEGIVYLDGNSLGPLPKAAVARIASCVTEEWGNTLIQGWYKLNWMTMPAEIGDRIGRLIGAPKGSTVLGDTLSIKVYQALASALELRPDRKVILTDINNFPSDLYMAEGLIRTLGQGHVLKKVAPEEVEANIGPDVAVLLLTQADYRTARLHDMATLTAKAHAAGALTIWDLAHTAGAMEIDVAGCDVDFAVGCTYKYLNSGPGGPAYIYVAPRMQADVRPALSGWLGHETPFTFDTTYRPGQGIERMRVGTPPIIQLAALEASMDIWDKVDMKALRTRSIELTEAFIAGVEATCPTLVLGVPRDPATRGSQVSFRHKDGGAIMQAMTARGVIGDFRTPDYLRFGFTPLFVTMEDVQRAVATLADVMAQHEAKAA